MGRITALRDLIGIIKDKVSQSKAAIVSKPKTISLHLAILRATSHDPFTPPNQRHITALLSFGYGSRATAAEVIEALMDRLQSTHDSSVAIKCLIAVHHIIKDGSFILQDQLSVYPSAGGRNYLKLSNFRDNTTPITWELSSWVRWYGQYYHSLLRSCFLIVFRIVNLLVHVGNCRYARYLEHLLSTSRILGFFLGSSSTSAEKDEDSEKVSALTNFDLLKEVGSLVSLGEEMCKRPESLHMHGNNVVDEVMRLMDEDYLSAVNDISIRVDEFNQRLSCFTFSDSVELGCVLRRLEGCKGGMLLLSTRKKQVIENLWCLINEMKKKVGGEEMYRKPGRLLLTMGSRGGAMGSESARFGDRGVSYGDSVRFSSGRFGLDGHGFAFVESVKS